MVTPGVVRKPLTLPDHTEGGMLDSAIDIKAGRIRNSGFGKIAKPFCKYKNSQNLSNPLKMLNRMVRLGYSNLTRVLPYCHLIMSTALQGSTICSCSNSDKLDQSKLCEFEIYLIWFEFWSFPRKKFEENLLVGNFCSTICMGIFLRFN